MPPGPFDVELDPETRRDLGERIRRLLEEGPLDVRGMAVGLGVEPEVVVVALRELRATHAGRLCSTIYLGRTAWWWEPAQSDPEPAQPAARRKHKAKHKKG
jgi:hypothetical protein